VKSHLRRSYIAVGNRTTTPTKEDRLVGIPEAAAYLGVTPRSIHNMLTDGRLKGYRLGARIVRIRKADIDAALEAWV
jgi:excisionase family DNA binding protein